MKIQGFRTDLAFEELPQGGGELSGVTSRSYDRDGFRITEVEVLDEQGQKSLCKPIGKYVTMTLDSFFRRQEDAFARAAKLLAECMKKLLPLRDGDSVLVAGLGNAAITPDAIGPEAARSTLATRHLKQIYNEEFAAFRPVSVFQTGVLGTTGMESAELIHALCRAVSPAAVIAVDALAARSTDALCRTVQLTDSGIVPGSGVSNNRAELSRRRLGVPVIAVGVPTVMDAGDGLIITPRDIDQYIRDAGRLIGYALNLALHPDLTISDVDMFVG